jgi:hypothetical protein
LRALEVWVRDAWWAVGARDLIAPKRILGDVVEAVPARSAQCAPLPLALSFGLEDTKS